MKKLTKLIFLHFLEDFIYLFIFREERERNINVWLPLARPLLGTWPETQACAPTGNRTHHPVLRRPLLKSTEPHQLGKLLYF